MVKIIYGAFYDRSISDHNFKELKIVKWWFAHHQIINNFTLPENGSVVIDPVSFTGQNCATFRTHLPPGKVTITMEDGIPISVMENNNEYTKESSYTEEKPILEHFFLCPDKRHAIVITDADFTNTAFTHMCL